MLQLVLYSGIGIVYRYNFTHTYHKDFSNTNYYYLYKLGIKFDLYEDKGIKPMTF